MIVFIVGGSKSKKSYYGEKFAESLRSDNGNLYYLATMKPYGEEDTIRIKEHIRSRYGHGYITIEKDRNINEIITQLNKRDTVLLDSITALVTNEMFNKDKIVDRLEEKISSEIKILAKSVNNLVLVSDYIFADGIKYDEVTENFRREIGRLNCSLASLSDIVIEVSFGNLIIHKGKERIKDETLN